MNKNVAIGLVMAGIFVIAFFMLWNKKDKEDGSAPGTNAGQEQPKPGPAKPVTQPPRPLPKPLPVPAVSPLVRPKPGPGPVVPTEPVEGASTSRKERRGLLDTSGRELEELAGNQETVVPWLKKKKSDGPAPEPSTRSYTVESTMSLFQIAEDVLGDGSRWREILSLNNDAITNSDRVPRGTVLQVPKTGARKSLLDRVGEDGKKSGGKASISGLID